MANQTYNKKLAQEIARKLPDKTLFNRILNDENAAISDACLTQMSYVVDYLYDKQIAYRIEQTTNGGYIQLQAVTDSPKARITLTGKDNHIDFIGSGIKANQRYAFTTTPYDATGRSIAGQADATKTYRPSQSDIENLLDTYLQNNMSSYQPAGQTRSLNFTAENGRNVSRRMPNTYYMNGKLRKAYKTIDKEDGAKDDVELVIQPIQPNIEGELIEFSNAVKTVSSAISNSHDYLVEEIMKASEFISGKVSFSGGNRTTIPADYGIDNGEISDMIFELRNECQNSESFYGVEFAEAQDKTQAIRDIVSHYVSTRVLGLSCDEDGEILGLPKVDPNGSFEATRGDIPVGFTLNPTAVSAWTALSENDSNVISRQKIQSAMRGMHLSKENIVGDDNRNDTMADNLISFDESTGRGRDDFDVNSFEYKILTHTEEHLASLGIEATCRLDDNGIIQIDGIGHGLVRDKATSIPVKATIGQIFAPDEYGAVHVRRNQSDNFLFIPGYRGFVVEDDGSGKNVMERTQCFGYYKSACSNIDNALSTLVNSTARALNSRTTTEVNVSIPTACNSLYGETYGTRLAEDFEEKAIRNGFDRDFVIKFYQLLSRKIAYSREIDSEATTINSIGGESQKTRALEITGQNMREMGEECKGFVYNNVTNTGRGSGTRRYLCMSAQVDDETGFIIKGDENDLTPPLFESPLLDGIDKNALDRIVMVVSQLQTANGIAKDAVVAHIIVDGWTLDDGYVISKEFAETYQVPDAETGELRPVRIGDKISDGHGNKGVVNFIVDPEMSMEEAKAQKVENLVALFKLNPRLDAIGAPYSGMSRSNAGTAHCMLKNASDLILPNGEVIPGGMGTLNIILTGMTVDAKSHIYDNESDHKRNSSGQLSWVLSSKKLDAIARELYGDNDIGLSEARAYYNIIGVTLDEKGTLHTGFGASSSTIGQAELVDNISQDVAPGAIRVKKFDEYVLDEQSKDESKRFRLQRKLSAEKWNAEAKNFNGFLQLPFPVQGADGNDLTVNVTDGNGTSRDIFVMPVVSAAYRSDIRHDNGETYSHDFTKNYAAIVKAAGDYMSASVRLGKLVAKNAAALNIIPTGMTEAEFADKVADVYTTKSITFTTESGNKITQPVGFREMVDCGGKEFSMGSLISWSMKNAPVTDQNAYHALRAEHTAARVAGQSEYTNIVNETVAKKFEDHKHGAIATSIVKVGCDYSATAVWTADSRLPINCMAMSQEMYDKLNIQDGRILAWRDPILTDKSMRYFDIVINNDLTGVAVHPMVAQGFQGDFDGDSIGLKALQTKEAQTEAYENLSIKANILDYGIGENGRHPILLQSGMDVQAAFHANPKMKAEWEKLTEIANQEVQSNGVVSDKTFERIDKLAHTALRQSSFKNVMRYESPESVAESLLEMSKEYGNGAKGNVKKMKGFMEYLGYNVDVDANGKVSLTYSPMDAETRFQRNKDVCKALGCKCDETGVAGYASQKALRALRDVCPTEALELTFPVTQGMLQAKHNADEAALKADLTQNVIPDLWEGKRMVQSSDGKWSIAHSSTPTGRSVPRQATKEEWKDQFMRIMCQANGIDIPAAATPDETRASFAEIMNPNALDIVADALTNESGHIVGVTEKAAQQSSYIDNMMYGAASSDKSGKTSYVDYTIEAAKNHVNIFSNGGMIFAPNSVRHENGWPVSSPVQQATTCATPIYLNELPDYAKGEAYSMA